MASSETTCRAQKRTSIVFVCSIEYLLFTLVAARQSRRFSQPDVQIVVFLDDQNKSDAWMAAVTALTGIQLQNIPPDVLQQIEALPNHRDHFKQSHLNRSSLLRLRIADLVDPDIERILYLDGDVQIQKSLTPLFEIEAQPGKFLVVRDWKAHQSHEGMPEAEAERVSLANLSLPEIEWPRYFNTGVMLADRATWQEFGPKALAFYQANPEHCMTADQCALNAVAFGATQLISTKWNCLRSYMNLPGYKDLDAAILHFAAPPKPWDGPLLPWGRNFFKPYQEMANLLWEFELPWKRMPAWKRLKWQIRMLRKVEYADQSYRTRMDELIRQDG